MPGIDSSCFSVAVLISILHSTPVILPIPCPVIITFETDSSGIRYGTPISIGYAPICLPNVTPPFPRISCERCSFSKCFGSLILESCDSHLTSFKVLPVGNISSNSGASMFSLVHFLNDLNSFSGIS